MNTALEIAGMTKILIVEDEPAMVSGLRDNFEFEGYQVITAADGVAGLERALADSPDLVILDVMMPRMSGLDVCKQLKTKRPSVPIIMLTARGQEVDKVVGLELGADDYVTKPFSIRELLARVKAVLRRAQPVPKDKESATWRWICGPARSIGKANRSIFRRKSSTCSSISCATRARRFRATSCWRRCGDTTASRPLVR